MLLKLQKGIIYGPIHSRRLGHSLGINILPSDKKVCPFNCLYCQYGWTDIHISQPKPLTGMPSAKEVSKALKEALTTIPRPPAYITFSGNGEPTLHPDFNQIVEEVIFLRDQFAPESKTAIISNSALVSDPTLREALSQLDMRIMKMDCGTTEMFKRYNQPCAGVDLEEINLGLTLLSDISIQTLLTSGKSGNLESESITTWIRRVKRIKPSNIQLYTLDRGYPANDLQPVSRETLLQIKEKVQREGLPVKVF